MFTTGRILREDMFGNLIAALKDLGRFIPCCCSRLKRNADGMMDELAGPVPCILILQGLYGDILMYLVMSLLENF